MILRNELYLLDLYKRARKLSVHAEEEPHEVCAKTINSLKRYRFVAEDIALQIITNNQGIPLHNHNNDKIVFFQM
jgi:hypothetical protein